MKPLSSFESAGFDWNPDRHERMQHTEERERSEYGHLSRQENALSPAGNIGAAIVVVFVILGIALSGFVSPHSFGQVIEWLVVWSITAATALIATVAVAIEQAFVRHD